MAGSESTPHLVDLYLLLLLCYTSLLYLLYPPRIATPYLSSPLSLLPFISLPPSLASHFLSSFLSLLFYTESLTSISLSLLPLPSPLPVPLPFSLRYIPLSCPLPVPLPLFPFLRPSLVCYTISTLSLSSLLLLLPWLLIHLFSVTIFFSSPATHLLTIFSCPVVFPFITCLDTQCQLMV